MCGYFLIVTVISHATHSGAGDKDVKCPIHAQESQAQLTNVHPNPNKNTKWFIIIPVQIEHEQNLRWSITSTFWLTMVSSYLIPPQTPLSVDSSVEFSAMKDYQWWQQWYLFKLPPYNFTFVLSLTFLKLAHMTPKFLPETPIPPLHGDTTKTLVH